MHKCITIDVGFRNCVSLVLVHIPNAIHTIETDGSELVIDGEQMDRGDVSGYKNDIRKEDEADYVVTTYEIIIEVIKQNNNDIFTMENDIHVETINCL